MGQASNVVSLPRARRRRKSPIAALPCQVLQFTGTKRFVYDREEILRAHKQEMVDRLFKHVAEVHSGAITGLMVVSACGSAADAVDVSLSGIFMEQPRFAQDSAQRLADQVVRIVDKHHSFGA